MTNYEVLKKRIAATTTEKEFVELVYGECGFDCHRCEQYVGGCHGNPDSCQDAWEKYLKMPHKPTFSEQEEPVHIMRVRMMCSCGGEMLPVADETGFVFGSPTGQVTYKHRCNQCETEHYCDAIYPILKPEE